MINLKLPSSITGSYIIIVLQAPRPTYISRLTKGAKAPPVNTKIPLKLLRMALEQRSLISATNAFLILKVA